MKQIYWTNNEIINEDLLIDLNEYNQNEELEIFIRQWDHNDSKLNIKVIHNAGSTVSRIKVRAVITDSAKLKITGLVKINKGMKGSDTYFDARILTLSEKANGTVTPGLEIDENDVKAGHSASVTNISERDLFYLTSRGIDRKTAESLIEKGFLGEKSNFEEETNA